MLLQDFQQSGLLFNSNFLEASSSGDVYGYRGELVLIEGEVADAKGHVKPPIEVMRGVVLLADDKIKLVVGAIDRLESLLTFVDKYKDSFADDMKAVLYVVNINEPMQVEFADAHFVLIPLIQGVPWNEIIDELALEKSDFKGQTAADKIVTLYAEIQSYKPKYLLVSLDEALAATTDTVREGWGAV
ncbi:MAG: hypothetical protein PVG66_03300 [Chromatiales bacterium]|jgi:hypothetical protein